MLDKRILKIFSPSGSHTILFFFRTKRHGNILTGTPLTGALNAGGVDRNRDSQPISGFIECCERPTAINTIVGRYPAIDRCDVIHHWTLVRPVVYHSHSASLFTAQKATHQ